MRTLASVSSGLLTNNKEDMNSFVMLYLLNDNSKVLTAHYTLDEHIRFHNISYKFQVTQMAIFPYVSVLFLDLSIPFIHFLTFP